MGNDGKKIPSKTKESGTIPFVRTYLMQFILHAGASDTNKIIIVETHAFQFKFDDYLKTAFA